MSKHHPLRVIVGLVLLGLATNVLVAALVVASAKHRTMPSSLDWVADPDGTVWGVRGSLGILRIKYGTMIVYPLRHSDVPEFAHSASPVSTVATRLCLLEVEKLLDRHNIKIVESLLSDQINATSPIREDRIFASQLLSDGAKGAWAFGWPFPVAYELEDHTRLTIWLVPPDERPPNIRNLRPLYLGLALNTAFYAALWGMVLVARPAARRWNRRRRGLCPQCGYDISGLATCPERGMGSAVTSA